MTGSFILQSEPALNRNASLWEAQLDSGSGEIRDRAPDSRLARVGSVRSATLKQR